VGVILLPLTLVANSLWHADGSVAGGGGGGVRYIRRLTAAARYQYEQEQIRFTTLLSDIRVFHMRSM
jgi:hypothetical protein